VTAEVATAVYNLELATETLIKHSKFYKIIFLKVELKINK
jgi:hypothetical protein